MKSIYPVKLEDLVQSNNYIPRLLRPTERLKLYHKYWFEEYRGVSKVIDIFYIYGVEYYTIKHDDNNKESCISYPLTFDVRYELLHNYQELEYHNIINSGNSYTGAEIRYWFIKNDYTQYKYRGFLKFLYTNTPDSIIDNKKYTVSKKKNKCTIELE